MITYQEIISVTISPPMKKMHYENFYLEIKRHVIIIKTTNVSVSESIEQ